MKVFQRVTPSEFIEALQKIPPITRVETDGDEKCLDEIELHFGDIALRFENGRESLLVYVGREEP